jgi:hypothetical protein
VAAIAPKAGTGTGEVLSFENPSRYFGQLSVKNCEIVRATQGKCESSVRELALAVGHDVNHTIVLITWIFRRVYPSNPQTRFLPNLNPQHGT